MRVTSVILVVASLFVTRATCGTVSDDVGRITKILQFKELRMSVTRYNGTKILLPRSGADEFWNLIHVHFAGEDPRRWKYLAMLALRENAGWPLERIGQVFAHPKGHVTRCLASIKAELRARFQASPEFLEMPDDEIPVETVNPASGAITIDSL